MRLILRQREDDGLDLRREDIDATNNKHIVAAAQDAVHAYQRAAAGTLLVNYGIKPAVDRIRPYITLKDTPFWDVYNTYWTAAGAHLESDPSFPSGHTSTNFEMFTALTGMLRIDGHKWAWFFMIIPFIVAVSRIIRCVHYPSDVIAGMICGLITGLLGIGISYLIFCRKKKTA